MENKIIIPNSFMGVNGEEALQRIISEKTKPLPQKKSKPSAQVKSGIVLGDPRDYLFLEGRKHGNYSYPDSLVSIQRLSLSSEVAKSAKKLNLNLENNSQGYIGNINSEESEALLGSLGHQMLTIRQFVDFLNLLRSDEVYRGNGDKLSKLEAGKIYQDIVEVRDPWRAEWLNAKFHISKNQMLLIYMENNGKYSKAQHVGKCLMKDKDPGISLDDWLITADDLGLPKSNVKKGQLYYYHPRDGAVARFDASSGRADLYCVRDPTGRGSGLGVRAVREKI